MNRDWRTPWTEGHNTLDVKEIMGCTIKDIWNIPEGRYNVVFDDGVTIASSKRRIILDRHIWQLFEHTDTVVKEIPTGYEIRVARGNPVYVTKEYWELMANLNNVPITHQCSSVVVMDNMPLSGSTHIKTMNNCFLQIIGHLNIRSYADKEYLLEKVIRTNSSIYNDIILELGSYLTTLDALDIVSFMKLPEVKDILDNIENHPDSIDAAHKRMTEFVMSTDIDHPLMLPNKSGSIRNTQFNQCVGPRGFVTDLDRTVYGDAITTGFFRGLRNYYDYLIESRTGAKALEASDRSIKTSEYTSRRFTIQSMVVEKPVFGDCGSTNYRTIVVTDRYLPNMVGKWYLDSESNELKMITGDEEHLIGEKIKYRHTNGCMLPERKNVCTTCLGELSSNLHYHTNLGAEAMLFFMQKITQGLLSFKHEVKSVSSGVIVLDSLASHWFTSLGDNQLGVNTERNLKGVSMIINKRGMDRLMDVLTSSELDIPMSNIGELEGVGIMQEGKPTGDYVTISNTDRRATITIELLNYMRTNTDMYFLDERGNYVIKLDEWKVEDPMFFIPLKEADVLAFLNMIVKLIEGTNRRKYTPDEHFFELTDLILSRSNCNFTVLEVMAYAVSTFNPDQGNYRLSRFSPNPGISSRNDIFAHRSKGQLLPYEHQHSPLVKKPMISYDNPYGEGHPLDIQFMPQEMIMAGRNGVN